MSEAVKVPAVPTVAPDETQEVAIYKKLNTVQVFGEGTEATGIELAEKCKGLVVTDAKSQRVAMDLIHELVAYRQGVEDAGKSFSRNLTKVTKQEIAERRRLMAITADEEVALKASKKAFEQKAKELDEKQQHWLNYFKDMPTELVNADLETVESYEKITLEKVVSEEESGKYLEDTEAYQESALQAITGRLSVLRQEAAKAAEEAEALAQKEAAAAAETERLRKENEAAAKEIADLKAAQDAKDAELKAERDAIQAERDKLEADKAKAAQAEKDRLESLRLAEEKAAADKKAEEKVEESERAVKEFFRISLEDATALHDIKDIREEKIFESGFNAGAEYAIRSK